MFLGEVLAESLIARLPPFFAIGGVVGEAGRGGVGVQGKPEGT